MKRIKKILASLMVAVMVLTAAPLSGFVGLELPDWFDFTPKASAESFSGTCGDNLTWSLDTETGELVISGTGAMYNYSSSSAPWYSYSSSIKKVTIADGVTSIGSSAFSYCTILTSITIPDSVTSIDDWAFYNCRNLTSITIGNGVTSIGSCAFSGCKSLTSITIPDSVTSIGSSAFSGCTSLTSITIPDSVTSIGDDAFYFCTSLTSITIPDGVTSIGNDAFYNCSGLKELTMPISANIYNSSYTFYNCTNIEKITLTKGNGTAEDYGTSTSSSAIDTYYGYTPWYISRSNLKELVIEDGVTGIGSYMFYYCTILTSITIPDSVTSIGSSAFEGCTRLTSITIPDSVTSIGSSAFRYCTSLTSIIIPDSVTSIGSSAFYGCTSLASITIPDSVTSIGSNAFYNCTGLTSVTVMGKTTSFGGSVFSNRDKIVLYLVKDSSAETYAKNNDIIYYYLDDGTDESLISVTVTPKLSFEINKETYTMTVNCIGNMISFTNADAPWYQYRGYIKHIVINDGCNNISDSAFKNMGGLESLIIPDSVTSIGSYAFSGCKSLTSITIPDSVTSIGEGAFYNCSGIKELTMPISAKMLYNSENTFYRCTNIEKITLTKGDGTAENYSTSTCRDTPWYISRSSLKELTIEDGVTGIGSYAFSSCTSLTSVTIPDSVTSIGADAFSDCTSLTSVTIPDSVTSIGDYAFSDCTSLTSVTIPDNVTSIGSYAFSDCTSLTSVTIPDSVTSIDDYAFQNCSGLADVSIGDSVTSIGFGAFVNCTSLTSITIPDSVTSIGDYAFSGCASLTSITIPDSVTSIGSSAFSYCTSLTSITIPYSVTSIGSYAFAGCTGITDITVGNNVTSINANAFNGCTSLENITLPFALQSIGDNAFAGCSKLKKLKVYSRNCSFGTECTSYYTTIVGYAGSTAEAYANEMGFNFELIPDDDHEHIYSNSCDADCNICGHTRTDLVHTYSSVCDITCDLCTYKRTDVVHTYSNDCDPECDVCGYTRTELTHTYDNDCDTECNYCDFVRTPSHTDDNNDGLCDVCEKTISDILVGVTQNFKVKVGETVYIKFVPANSGVYTFYSSSSADTYGYIFDANKNQLASDDDSSGNGNNFSITYTFKSGTVYYLGVRYYSSSSSGEIPVTIRLDRLICDHNHTHEEHQDSTCAENGYDKVICDDCGQTIYDETLPLAEHDIKTDVFKPTCEEAGAKISYCKQCSYAYVAEHLASLGHSELVWVTVKVPSTRNEGIMNQVCPACGEVFDTKTVPAISLSADSTANIDFETNTISGFVSGSSSIGDYLSATNNGYTFTCESDTIGTGTVITLTTGEDMINEFEAVIFGDTNGDGWYDGQDAIIVDCLANGMLTKEDVGEAVYMAADCNHDGVIDQADVALLNEAGTLLANVDQSKPTEVLLETSAEYVEYISLIDQSPEFDVEDETDIPEADVETEDTTPEQNEKVDIFEMILNFIRFIFEMILSRIPVPYK